MLKSFKRVAILGASRGLGAEITRQLQAAGKELRLYSRKEDLLKNLAGQISSTSFLKLDLAQESEAPKLIEDLAQFNPDLLIYCAGGGPFGNFESKSWKDHMWAWQLNFLTPSEVLHWALREGQLKQMVFVGSAIAENTDEPMAPSYASAKKAFKGLYGSVVATKPNLDLRLFSPGYMDTELLPPNANVRQTAKILQPQAVAEQLITWLEEGEKWSHMLVP